MLACLLLSGCSDGTSSVDAGLVTLTIGGAHGNGIATSEPAGIQCGRCDGPPPNGPLTCPDPTMYTDCTSEFASGSTVQVTLRQSSYQVMSCNGQVVSGHICTVTMDGPKTLSISGASAVN